MYSKTILMMLLAFVLCDVVIAQGKEDEAQSYMIKGRERCKAEDFKGAIDYLNKAIELNPEYAEAYYWRGIAKRKSGDDEGAGKDFFKGREVDPYYKADSNFDKLVVTIETKVASQILWKFSYPHNTHF